MFEIIRQEIEAPETWHLTHCIMLELPLDICQLSYEHRDREAYENGSHFVIPWKQPLPSYPDNRVTSKLPSYTV